MKFLCTAALLVIGLGLPDLASAQNASYNALDNRNTISTTAGFHIVIPFGGQHTQVQDRARFGFMLDLTHVNNRQGFATTRQVNTNLLDFGWGFDGRPTMLFCGTDVYTPLFTPLSTNEEHQKNSQDLAGTGITKNVILMIAGGALAAGAAMALASNDDKDDDSTHDNDNDH